MAALSSVQNATTAPAAQNPQQTQQAQAQQTQQQQLAKPASHHHHDAQGPATGSTAVAPAPSANPLVGTKINTVA
jgi:hypothetical protein